MDKVHVATVNIVKGKGLVALYRPLGDALAPLGVYLTPFVQDMNYLNKVKYKGEMTTHEFLRMLRERRYMKNVEIQESSNGESLDVYANADV